MTARLDAATRRLVAAGLSDDPEAAKALAAWRRPWSGPSARIGLFAPPGAPPMVEGAAWRALSTAADADGCDWIGVLAAGDVPAPDGFARLAAAANEAGADAIYGDDLLLGPSAAALRLKPVFDPLLLARFDYIGRAVLFRAAALPPDALAALAGGAAPAKVLRRPGAATPAHLPFPVLMTDAPEPAPGPPKPPAAAPTAAISVVIPNRDSPALMRMATDGVLRLTEPAPGAVIVADNGSTDPETLELYEALGADPRVRVDIRPAPFNFSAMVNRGAALAAAAGGDGAGPILLLNNDIEVIEPGWLGFMAETLAAPKVGVVGAKLLFPDRSIQHAGVIVGHGGVAGHDRKGMRDGAPDPLGRMTHPHERAAVTAACMLIRREVWEALSGFDETAFPVAFNDVDFCLRARRAGWRVALEPRAVLIHHEGASRRGPPSLSRFLAHRRERAALRARHGTRGMVDPFESPWRDHDDLTPNANRAVTAPKPRRP